MLPNRRDATERPAARSVIEAAESGSYDPTSCFAIRLALEEALSNAYKHGNKNDPEKTVTLQWTVQPGRIEIQVEDEGEGFDTARARSHRGGKPGDPLRPGPGAHAVVHDEREYLPPGNRVRLVYEKPR